MTSFSTDQFIVNVGKENSNIAILSTSGDESDISIDTKNKLDATGIVSPVMADSDFNTHLENIVKVNNATF